MVLRVSDQGTVVGFEMESSKKAEDCQKGRRVRTRGARAGTPTMKGHALVVQRGLGKDDFKTNSG